MKKAYALLTVLLPILSVYASPISWFDLGTFCVLVFAIFCLVDVNNLKFSMSKYLVWILVYTIATTGINLFIANTKLYSEELSVIMRTARFAVLLVIMLGIGYGSYFDFALIKKYLRVVTLIVAWYAVAQWLFFNVTGAKLINVFAPTKQGVEFESALSKYETTYRPPSLFLEPSSMAYYVMPYLCYTLFRPFVDKKDSKQAYIDAGSITLGVICTTSGQGMLCVLAVWAIWVLRYLFTNRAKKGVPVLIAVVIIAIAVFATERVSFAFERIFTKDVAGSAVVARYHGYKEFMKLDSAYAIFGTGYGNYDENIYFSSFSDLLFCTGLVGFLSVLFMYLRFIRKGCFYKKALAIVSLILMAGGGIYTATLLCFYLPLFFVKEEQLNLFQRKGEK